MCLGVGGGGWGRNVWTVAQGGMGGVDVSVWTGAYEARHLSSLDTLDEGLGFGVGLGLGNGQPRDDHPCVGARREVLWRC